MKRTQLPETPPFHPVPDDAEALGGYVNSHMLVLQGLFRIIHIDLTQGNITHTVLSAIPSVDDLDDGALAFVHTSAVDRIYVRMNSKLYYITLTAA